ncbi:G-type lectin S-receptor-like serine/threonine-protein kinase CES [Forsythia ovata]|uniref:Receptor-like serine/threonine-protein kinase n=1 Tax=Forsythia ovata TaxID=205694 RepID=A0ABD1WEI9_9LAMI
MQKAVSITIIIFFVIFYHSVSIVSSVDTLKQGDTLNSSADLVSANRVFTLGFYSPQNTNRSYLGIWFTHNTYGYGPIWLCNRDKPITDNSGVLTISSTMKLIINSSGGDPIDLYANENGMNITATLLNSGNFVVKEMSINGPGDKVLWQSFDYPTDTLLPGMKIGVNHRTRRNWSITSWLSENNPVAGDFMLEWDPSRHRLIIRRRGVVYWTSGDLKDYINEGRPDLKLKKFENIGYEYNPYNFVYNFVNVTNDDEDYMSYFLEIDPDRTPDLRKNSGWKLNYDGYVYDIDNRIIVDVKRCYGYNTEVGCELWEQPNCRNHKETFVLKSGHFRPTDSYIYDNKSSLTESDCRRKDSQFVQSLDGVKIYVLISEPANKRKKKKKIWIVMAVVITVVLLLLGCSWLIMRKIKQGKWKEEVDKLMTLEDNDRGNGHDLRLFTYSSILAATNSFSSENKLGGGGFGPVYMGKMVEGREITVKVLLRRSDQGLLEFKTELILISNIQHVNLVKLLGFCIHGDEKMIVYDYMPNKSLDFYLFDPAKKELLNWDTRFNIIEGIAQGLLYLHKYSRLRIIHRDLKAGNILLDENMNPKISDFGLAKIFKQNVMEANTNRRVGTYGYMAPEYAMQGIYSVKSDVYSFGVLVLEIVSGQKNNSFHNEEGPLNLVEYAWELWSKDAALELVDPTLKSSRSHIDQLQRCIHVGLLCLENRATDRPTTEDVVSMLKNETMMLPMPKCPAFVSGSSVVYELENVKSEKFSANGLSMSAVDGR